MCRFNIIASGILLILLIIDFAVAAPVLAQGKLQADPGADAVHTGRPEEDATTALEKRGYTSGWNDLWLKTISLPPERHIHLPGRPDESSAARLPSSSQLPAPAGGWTNVKLPLPSIPEEPAPGWTVTNLLRFPKLTSKLAK